MAVAYEGGVIVGADSRTSTGAYIANRVSDKVTAVDDSIFVCRSGSAADTQAISDYVTYFLDQHRMELGKPPKVLTAANLFRELCYHNKNALMAGIIVAGWDQYKGGQVYSIPMGGAMLERPYAIGGAREKPRPYHPSFTCPPYCGLCCPHFCRKPRRPRLWLYVHLWPLRCVLQAGYDSCAD